MLAGHRRRAHVHDAGASLDEAVDLGQRGGGIGERDHRRGDDAPVDEAPVLLEPAVEGGEARHRGLDVALERLLDAAAEGGEQHDRGEALLLGDLLAGLAVAVLRVLRERLDLHERAGIDALGDLAAEHAGRCSRGR